jgi:hypothetical protein
MDVEQVKARVEEIRKCAGDDERAHSMEDELRCDVLTAIALGQCDDPQGCAEVTLETRYIRFSRWCA